MREKGSSGIGTSSQQISGQRVRGNVWKEGGGEGEADRGLLPPMLPFRLTSPATSIL